MNVRRVGIVFDDTARPETTGVYCRRALEELVRESRLDKAVHLRPDEFSDGADDDFDLYLVVDDGIVSRLPSVARPSVWWAIDTHLRFERCLAVAKQAAFTFCAQRDGAPQMRAAGIETASWLPLACDPQLHGRVETPRQWDVAFVGNVFPGERQRLLEVVQERFPNTFVGNRYFEQMAGTYSAAKCVFNRGIANDINMRVFEGLCSGSLVVTNALEDNGLPELFQDGRHLVTYASDIGLLEKLAYYVEHDDEREQIAAAGRAEVLARHTYRHRIEAMLAAISTATEAPSSAEPCETVCCQRSRNCRGSGKRCRKRRQKSRSRQPDLANTTRNGTSPTASCRGHVASNPVRAAVQAKEPNYFEFDRPDVLELVPESAQRVLDIGCGAGRLGASIKARQACTVIGIELSDAAAVHARQHLDQVIVANIETDDLPFVEGEFDCVICADVLEHLREPADALKKIRQWLKPDGCLVASIPNVRHHTVVQSLLAGNWTYESAGLLDTDHVRFFTRREIEKLLFRCGFETDELRMVPGDGYAEWTQRGRPLEVSVGALQIRAASPNDAQEFFAYQWLVRAVPARRLIVDDVQPQPERSFEGLSQLAEQHPWPAERPDVAIPDQHSGWFGDGAKAALMNAVSPRSRLIVELGSWLGLSTRFLAERAPDATVIAVDHWRGSPEHLCDPQLQELLPNLYDGFLASCWEYRDRVQPLQMTTLEGLQAIADAGLVPDLIFVDADHRYDAVCADLVTCRRLFPDTVLAGDDFSDPDVRRAVEDVARAEGLRLQAFGRTWLGWTLTPPQQIQRGCAAEAFGLTSIIIPTHNQLPYTKACLDSIRLRTDEPYEIIVVDNGSTDGTVEYLQSFADVRLIENGSNRGFPAAVNQGVAVAQGEHILLLNNDTIVTTGWLRRMLEALQTDPSIGLVGPVSNNVSGEQQIPVGYAQLAELDGWAWDRQAEFGPGGAQLHHTGLETDRLVGFCLLITREVIERVGVLDERFGIGCFEDDDFCRRVMEAGYRAVIAQASFVHHFGSTTFRGSGVDLGDVLRRNGRLYQQKWAQGGREFRAEGREGNGHDSLSLSPSPSAQSEQSNTNDATTQSAPGTNPLRLSVCLIVRDNEHTIRPCLESIRPWVDEIIVVDTGSTDRTPEICEELGAQVFHWAWRDDFAAARNVSLEHARGDWLLWMDSDDTIPEECGRKLRALADGRHDDHIFGYVLQVHCPGDDPTDVTVVDHVKLIRNRPDLRFEFRIHEQILPSIRRADGDVAFTDIYVVHSGSDRSKQGQARKLERDFKLLHLELQDRPEHPFVLFNLGMTCADCGQLAEAIDYLERCITVSRPAESHLRKAFALLVSVLSRDGHTEAAIDRCDEGLRLYPADKELLFRRAMLHHERGELDEAAATYERVLSETIGRHFQSIDAGIVGAKARHNLAIVVDDLRRRNGLAVRASPTAEPPWFRREKMLKRRAPRQVKTGVDRQL